MIDTDLPDNLDRQESLFAVEETPLPVSLADRFIMPPFSVLDRRQGAWQDRKRTWLSMGFQSEIGRAQNLTYNGAGADDVSQKLHAISGGTSVFDPVLAELAYRWFSLPGDRVLDPFAGGSVRGIVASALARYYTGIELRPEQIEANRAQAHKGSDIEPVWLRGDATTCDDLLDPMGYEADLVFTCPPYAYLEVYSDDPADLSTMKYPDFVAAVGATMRATYRVLRKDRFCIWVISDVRATSGGGDYHGVIADTIKEAQAAGFGLYNDAIVLDPIGTLAIRSGRQFESTRKLGRNHQHLLVFAKGDGALAGRRVSKKHRHDTEVTA